MKKGTDTSDISHISNKTYTTPYNLNFMDMPISLTPESKAIFQKAPPGTPLCWLIDLKTGLMHLQVSLNKSDGRSRKAIRDAGLDYIVSEGEFGSNKNTVHLAVTQKLGLLIILNIMVASWGEYLQGWIWH